MLVQLELPNEVVEQALHLAKEHEVQVLLDLPSPSTTRNVEGYGNLPDAQLDRTGWADPRAPRCEEPDRSDSSGRSEVMQTRVRQNGHYQNGRKGALMTTLKDSYHCTAPQGSGGGFDGCWRLLQWRLCRHAS